MNRTIRSKQMSKRAPRLTAVAVSASLLVFTGASSAMAADSQSDAAGNAEKNTSILENVKSAEESMGLYDDIVNDKTLVVTDGENFTIGKSDTSLSVTPGIERPSGTQSETIPFNGSLTYTVDKLDSSSFRLSSIHNSTEETEASWDLGAGAMLYVLEDGRVSVSDADGNLLAGIEAPWAVDANGNVIKTHYTASGSVLTQHIDAGSNTAFPVVADPTIRIRPGYSYVLFNRSESFTALGSVAACAAILSKSPYPGGKIASVACLATAGYGSAQLAGGKCLKLNLAGVPPLVTWWPTFPKC